MSSILLFTATPVGMWCRFKLIQAQTGNREKSLARACVLNSQSVFVRERIEGVGKSKRWKAKRRIPELWAPVWSTQQPSENKTIYNRDIRYISLYSENEKSNSIFRKIIGRSLYGWENLCYVEIGAWEFCGKFNYTYLLRTIKRKFYLGKFKWDLKLKC